MTSNGGIFGDSFLHCNVGAVVVNNILVGSSDGVARGGVKSDSRVSRTLEANAVGGSMHNETLTILCAQQNGKKELSNLLVPLMNGAAKAR
jgi:hypothetical protein